MVGGGQPIVHEILGQTDPVQAKTPTFKLLLARSASAKTPSEKNSVNNKRFPMKDERRCP